ncbi:MAG: hypothetical protein RR279_02405 [Alistipes sp.]
MRSKSLKILNCLLIALFVSYYAESTLFIHSHTFEWGTVTHSHPYLPGGGHSHTAGACQTIHSLNTILFTLIAAFALSVPIVVCFLLHPLCLQSVAKHIVENCSLRAPPLYPSVMSL